MFIRALLPVDGSRPSLSAVESAVRAVSPAGEIVLCHVIPTFESLVAGTATSARDSQVAMELAQHSHASRMREAQDYLSEAERQVEEAQGRVLYRLILQGEAGPQILRAASTHGCDVIAMATNGRSGWRRAILGSVADFVARNAEGVPVLLVRRSED